MGRRVGDRKAEEEPIVVSMGDDDNAARRPSGGRAAGWMIHGAGPDAPAPMILVVSLNPALDVTHHVAGVDWSGVNRPQEVTTAPGGKGLNVARTLCALGAGVQVIGLAGGVTGEAVRARLAAAGVAGTFTPIAGETRRTFAVVDTSSHDTALFNEPGPAVAAGEYQEFLVLYQNSLA